MGKAKVGNSIKLKVLYCFISAEMKTRNQIKEEEQAMVKEFTHEFFEESSKAWMKNKIRDGLMYRYKRAAFQEPIPRPVKEPVRRSKRLLEKSQSS